MLGTVDTGYLFDLLEALVRRDAAATLAVAEAMEARSLSFDDGLAELARILHRVALAQAAPEALPEDAPERERVTALAGALDPEDVQLYYQIALNAREDLALAPDEYTGFTMALMRMHAFSPETAGDEPAHAPAREERKAESAPPARSRFDWPAVARALKLTGAAKQLAERSELLAFDDNSVELAVPPESRALADKAYVEKLKAALAEHLGRPVRVTVRLAVVNGRTAAGVAESERRARDEQANAQVGADPLVRELVTGFDATIESVKPVE
jgi:DNA polymerase-3 subunit gamma/tau